MTQGVRFDVCGNTLDTIERETGKRPAINSHAIEVQVGVEQILQLVESGYTLVRPQIGPVGGLLAAVEVDRPAAERDRRRRPALGAHDARGPRRGAHPGQPALDDHDPIGAGRRAKTDAQPPTVPAPTTTRSARSVTPPPSASRRG